MSHHGHCSEPGASAPASQVAPAATTEPATATPVAALREASFAPAVEVATYGNNDVVAV